MCPVLLHIYGPFSINAYGTAIVLGIVATLFLVVRDKRRAKLISYEDTLTLISLTVLSGLIGARLLYALIEPHNIQTWYDIFMFWEGGGAELGSVIAASLAIILFLYYKAIPLLPILDLAGTYAPILQAIARIGCFFAGCCYGAPTDVSWAVTYTHPLTLAPLNIAIHPTQLYNTIAYLAIFGIMLSSRPYLTKPGLCFTLYLMLASLTRFTIDFWRNDRVFLDSGIKWIDAISTYQWISVGIFVGSCIAGIFLAKRHKAS